MFLADFWFESPKLKKIESFLFFVGELLNGRVT